MKCPQAKNSCNPNDYAMKITTEKLPDRQINLNWLKPTKLDNFLECCVIITLAVAWVAILASILFS